VHEHIRANGERRFVEVIAAPLWGADGTFQGIIESMRDVTECLQAHESLQQYAERLRALSARLAEVAEAERQRLARELHDQVGQNLTALGINLNIIRTQMPEEIAGLVRSRLDDSLSLVEQTTERIRDVMADLRPPVLDDYGLVAALQWYGEQFTGRTGIAIAVEGEESGPRLSARVENALFRIVQEALTNVAKHAQATQVRLTVEMEDRTLRLVVADDGIGFDPAHLTESNGSQGWGLLTMTERAEAVGGHCCIESAPGQGARVIVEVDRPTERKL
jgi:signal transduction histidine kinase